MEAFRGENLGTHKLILNSETWYSSDQRRISVLHWRRSCLLGSSSVCNWQWSGFQVFRCHFRHSILYRQQ